MENCQQQQQQRRRVQQRRVEEVAKGNVASRNGLTGPKHKHQNERKKQRHRARERQEEKEEVRKKTERNARQVWLGVLIVVQVHVIALWALDELNG